MFSMINGKNITMNECHNKFSNKTNVYYKYFKELEDKEKFLGRHFTQLHGILQNSEQKLKNSFNKHRNNYQKYLKEFQNILAAQEKKLLTANEVASQAISDCNNVNLKKFTEALSKLADSSYHIIEEVPQKEIQIQINKTIHNTIKDHVKLDFPEFRKLQLLPINEAIRVSEDNFNINSESLSDISASSFYCSSTAVNNDIEESSVIERAHTESVKITYIKDPTDFYVQKLSATKLLNDIEMKMEKYVFNNPTLPTNIDKNRIYIVKSIENKWRRGRIVKIDQTASLEETYEVFLLDYGIVESNVTLDRIRNTQPLFNMESGFAIHCTLDQITPFNNEWYANDITRFQNMVLGITLEMQILQANNRKYTIALQKENNVDIRDWLIDTQIAKNINYYKLKRINPLSAHQFYYEDLPMHQFTNIKVSVIKSPFCIYVQKADNKDFQNKMRLFYEQYRNLLQIQDLTISYPEYGNAVAVSSPPNWQRAIITKIIMDKSMVKIFLVDYGYSLCVEYNKITHLPNRFCTWNAQAIKVSLIDVRSRSNEISSTEINQYLKRKLENKIVKIMPISKRNNAYNAYIYLSDNTNVNANIVSLMFTEITGNNSKSESANKNKLYPKTNVNLANNNERNIFMNANENLNISKCREETQKTEDTDPFKVQVRINKVVSPDEIYVSDIANHEGYESMISCMQNFYKSYKSDSKCHLISQYYYCVYSSKHKMYLRAQYLRMLEQQSYEAKMLLIDMSELEDISIEFILPLHSRFMNVLKNTFKVKLAGIIPCGGTSVWQSSSCEKLNEIMHSTGNTKYYITLIESQDTDELEEILCIDLFIKRDVMVGPIEPNRKEIFSVARRLVDEGLALPIKGYSKNQCKEFGIELMKKLQLDTNNFNNTEKCWDSFASTETFEINNTEINNMERRDNNNVNIEYATSDPIKLNLLTENCNNWIQHNYSLPKTFEATFTFIDYECNVYFQLNSKECIDTINYIADTLQSHYDNKTVEKYYNWKKEDLCIVKYDLDEKWYRGRVEKIINSDTLEIFFIDFGNTEECQIDTICKEIILKDIPMQCIKAQLAGLKSEGEKWNIHDLDIIHKLIVSTTCRITVTSEPPNPLMIAVWVIKDSALCPLPFYLKNYTQTSCLIEDINEFYDSDYSN